MEIYKVVKQTISFFDEITFEEKFFLDFATAASFAEAVAKVDHLDCQKGNRWFSSTYSWDCISVERICISGSFDIADVYRMADFDPYDEEESEESEDEEESMELVALYVGRQKAKWR